MSSFEVSCIGTYMASGGYLQVECSSAPDGQDISALEYYVNGIFQGPGSYIQTHAFKLMSR